MEMILAPQTGTSKPWEVRDPIRFNPTVILCIFICMPGTMLRCKKEIDQSPSLDKFSDWWWKDVEEVRI